MPRVDIENAQKIIRLNSEGLSYTAIGKRLGYNNKTVSLWVKKAKELEKTRVMEVTGTDLNTRYTGEHHKMLLAAARGVYKAVSTPLPSVREGQEAKVLLEHQVLTGLQDLEGLLADRGLHVRPGEPGGTRDGDPELLDPGSGNPKSSDSEFGYPESGIRNPVIRNSELGNPGL